MVDTQKANDEIIEKANFTKIPTFSLLHYSIVRSEQENNHALDEYKVVPQYPRIRMHLLSIFQILLFMFIIWPTGYPSAKWLAAYPTSILIIEILYFSLIFVFIYRIYESYRSKIQREFKPFRNIVLCLFVFSMILLVKDIFFTINNTIIKDHSCFEDVRDIMLNDYIIKDEEEKEHFSIIEEEYYGYREATGLFAKQSYEASIHYKKGKILYDRDFHSLNYQYHEFKTEWLSKQAVELELKEHDYHVEDRNDYQLYILDNQEGNYYYDYIIRQDEKVIIFSLDLDCK